MMRRPPLVGLVLLVILAMAGCSGLPTTSSVHAGGAIDNHAPPTVGNIEYPGPAAGMSQKDIVGGFLDATAGTNQNYERAREYLTAAAGRSWVPRTVVVTSGSRDLMASGSNTVTATADSDASLDAQAHLTEEPDGATTTADFRLTKVNGEWRISKLPADFGLWMSVDQFKRIYQPQEVYYAAATGHTLVPDTQWYTQTGLVSSLAAAVMRGAPSWMDGMTFPPLPKGSELTGSSVSIDNDGVASVNVSEEVLSATPDQRTALWASMLATLGQVSEVRRVVVLVGGARLQAPGLPENPTTPSDFGYTAVSGNPAQLVGRTSQTQLQWMDAGDSGVDLRNKNHSRDHPTLPEINHNWYRLAISGDGQQVAAIDGADAVLGRWVDGHLSRIAGFGTDLVAPSFSTTRAASGDSVNELWVAGRSTSKDGGDSSAYGTLWVVDAELPVADAQPQPVDASWLRDKHITAIRLSPDGERIALAVTVKGGAAQVYVAGVVRDKKGHAQSLTKPLRVAPSLSGVQDVGWIDYLTLAVLCRDQGTGTVEPVSVPIGGLSSSMGETPGGTHLVATGAGASSLYVETDADTVLTRVGASWQKVPGVMAMIASGT
ncbi:MAG TPA: LpqB family beta-propeller domain-containing protein [Flexivirga sp.]|uniref:GerMN domain-containing protein n=1 Tax=Flexivirga sp. TaxID=1962927 RepID=UPI002C1D3373|nr:LpqB family beta-propeller domain-containing protein [Flexivirga sp.]HWC23279.1 LpqB family beta-propeller domain-containing protein [Flexivirga sp.]